MADYPRSAVTSDCRWDGRADIDSSNASHHCHLDRAAVTDRNRATVPIGSAVDGCSECNRSDPKPWPIYTVNYHGVVVCAKCLTPMNLPRRKP
jgi:hypothetical protein